MSGSNGSGPPGVQRVRLATANVDEATETLRARYSDHAPSFSGSPENFEFAVVSTAVATPSGVVSVDRLRNSLRVEALVEPFGLPTVLVPERGRVGFVSGRDDVRGSPMLCPTWGPFRSHWDDLEIAVGALDPDGLRRVGADIFGVDPAAVEFTGMKPISPDHARHVAATLHYLEHQLFTNVEAIAGPLVAAEAFRQLATALLLCFPNTGLAATPPERRGWADQVVVRRALAYIDEHAGEDIGMGDIAAAVRIGVQDLRRLFLRHSDSTPMEELRRVRLARAHADLQAGDPTSGDTVAAIAARWGFADVRAFSVQYQRVYGRPPSQTLQG